MTKFTDTEAIDTIRAILYPTPDHEWTSDEIEAVAEVIDLVRPRCGEMTSINGRQWACDLATGHFGMHGSLLADAFEGES